MLLRQLLYIENFFFIRLRTTITLVSQIFQKKFAYFFLCDLSFAQNMSRAVNNEKISKKVRFIVSLLNKLIQRMYSSYINSIVTTIYSLFGIAWYRKITEPNLGTFWEHFILTKIINDFGKSLSRNEHLNS